MDTTAPAREPEVRDDLVLTLASYMEDQTRRGDEIRLTPAGIAFALVLPTPTEAESLAVLELLR